VIDTEGRVHRSACVSEPDTKVYVGSWPERIDVFIYLSWSSFPYSSIAQIGSDSCHEISNSIQAFNMAIEKGATKLIFASSGGTVYGKHNIAERVNELHLLRPISGYGATKVAVEMYLAIIAANFQVDHISLRVGNPYGPYQFAGTPIGLIARFVANALEGVPHIIIGVTIQGSGRAAAQVHACLPMAERAKKQCCLCCGTQRSGSSDGITPPR
jgi:hypothetical protein